jgi:hypothetical protein
LKARAPHIVRPVAFFAASRVVVVLAIGATMALVPHLGFARAFSAWDGGWYLDIVARGYPTHVPHAVGHAGQSSTAFFPLFPLLVRATMRVTGLSAFRSGLVVSTVASAGAAVLIWMLVQRLADAGAADRAVALICFFPASFVLSMPYSEGVMLVCAAGCLLLLHERRWLAAGVAGALASAARPTGIACGVACAFAAAAAIANRREWRALLAPLIAPAGLIAFCVYLAAHTGDAFASFRSQRDGWHQRIDFGATTYHAVIRAFTDPFQNLNRVALTIALAIALVGVWAITRWRPPAFIWAYAAAALIPALLVASISSRPRFLLAAFPLLIAIAWRTRGPTYTVLLAVSAGLLAITTMLSVSMVSLTP